MLWLLPKIFIRTDEKLIHEVMRIIHARIRSGPCFSMRSPSCSSQPAAGSPAPNAPPGRSARSSAVVPSRRADGPCAGRMEDYQQAPRHPKVGLGSLLPRQCMDARRAAFDVNGQTTCWSCRCWRPWAGLSGCSQDRGREVRSHTAAEVMRCRHRVFPIPWLSTRSSCTSMRLR